jgi:predicted Zn-dependent protease
MMRKTIYIAALALVAATGFAQTLPEAIKKTENERFDAAGTDFRALIAKDPAKGENYFYAGQNYFRSGMLDENPVLIDSAAMMYNKGIELNATNPLNYVGAGKILLYKGNVNDAKAQFFKAASIAQNKNAEVMRRTGEAWIAETNNKNPDEAIAQFNNAIKLDPKNPENYILLGDAQLEKNPTDGSGPVKNYQQATTLDPKSSKGIVSEGRLYRRGRNYTLAVEKYKAALAIDPTYAPAYRELAEVYNLAGQHNKSIENWKKYLELNNSDQARYGFLNSLFKNKQYNEVIQEYDNLKKANFKNPILDRLAGYAYYEIGNKTDTAAYKKGLKAIEEFFQKAGPGFKYIGSDYKYKGLLMMKTGTDSLGVLEMEKAIATDASLAGDIFGEIAGISYKNKKYARAILYYEKKIALDPKSLNNNDWFNLGRAYYFSGQALRTEANTMRDALSKKKKNTETPDVLAKDAEASPYFIKADTAFSYVVRLNPAWPTSYLWRARANSNLDPKNEKWLAFQYYEKVLNVVKPEEQATYKSNMIEALEYMGDYYVNNKEAKNMDKAKETFTRLKELDPENPKAKAFFAPPAKPQPGGKPGGK